MTSLVLNPGIMCDARLFEPQIAAFSARHYIAARQSQTVQVSGNSPPNRRDGAYLDVAIRVMPDTIKPMNIPFCSIPI
jgi:hypothetical protein